ncbi:MAG: GEGP motif-containing diheme protein, partial [Desulfobacterales bacterium]
LNAYGRAYRDSGRDAGALAIIEDLDSDQDGFSNAEEITAFRYPGDEGDDPTKVTAPYRIFDLEDLEALPQHTQFMLMNTHKSGDFYAEYQGVPLDDLLEAAGILLPLAESIHVLAPDGWAQFHPLEPDPDPSFYSVYGNYPVAEYFYDVQADEALNPQGWCDYSAPSNMGRENGDPIEIEGGLKMILALRREGEYLEAGVLNEDNKLDGEGPFRVVPPQKSVGPPDQSTRADDPENPDKWIWPFLDDGDHNAGFATRSATMIRVDPLPQGTTDVNILEAGWNFVDEGKIIVYGAIDPRPRILAILDGLIAEIEAMDRQAFQRPFLKYQLLWKTCWLRLLVQREKDRPALRLIEKMLLPKVDGCIEMKPAATPGKYCPHPWNPAARDWIVDCELQKPFYWTLRELTVLLKILT